MPKAKKKPLGRPKLPCGSRRQMNRRPDPVWWAHHQQANNNPNIPVYTLAAEGDANADRRTHPISCLACSRSFMYDSKFREHLETRVICQIAHQNTNMPALIALNKDKVVVPPPGHDADVDTAAALPSVGDTAAALPSVGDSAPEVFGDDGLVADGLVPDSLAIDPDSLAIDDGSDHFDCANFSADGIELSNDEEPPGQPKQPNPILPSKKNQNPIQNPILFLLLIKQQSKA